MARKNSIDPEKAAAFINHIYSLTKGGYSVTFGPGPYPATVSLRVDNEDLSNKQVVDLTHTPFAQDPIDILGYTLNRMVWEIGNTLAVMKGE